MESKNGRRQSKLRTPFLHVPILDWAKVRCGEKREFRVPPMGGAMPYTQNMAYMPMLVVAWAETHAGIRYEELMILEEAWLEPLRAISPESLEAEGFADRGEFKRYWNRRHPRGGYRGLSSVVVLRIRPVDEDDFDEQRQALFQHLYGLWL